MEAECWVVSYTYNWWSMDSNPGGLLPEPTSVWWFWCLATVLGDFPNSCCLGLSQPGQRSI